MCRDEISPESRMVVDDYRLIESRKNFQDEDPSLKAIEAAR